MDIKTFILEVKNLGITVTEKELNLLHRYQEMLVSFNKKFNLTAITKEEEIYLKHFYDSLCIVLSLDFKDDLKVLDIGTGAGFPGIVLKIFLPNLEVTLMDSNNKKISFLKEVIKELNLEGIFLKIKRAELITLEERESYDVVTSRAVAHTRILSELALPYLKVGGFFLPLKGDIEKELSESKEMITTLGGEIKDIIKYILPLENSKRSILKIEKKKRTPNIYPRSYDKIKKELSFKKINSSIQP